MSCEEAKEESVRVYRYDSNRHMYLEERKDHYESDVNVIRVGNTYDLNHHCAEAREFKLGLQCLDLLDKFEGQKPRVVTESIPVDQIIVS